MLQGRRTIRVRVTIARRPARSSYLTGKHQLSSLPLNAIGMQLFMPSGQSSSFVQVLLQRPSMHTADSQSSSRVHEVPAAPVPRAPGTQQGTGSNSVPAF